MADLYNAPVFYGIQDANVQEGEQAFGVRIYYPTNDDAIWEAPIRSGSYPLLVFAHGQRRGDSSVCPLDVTQDYKRWEAVLHLLARCGFVVAVPAIHDPLRGSVDRVTLRVERTVEWMRQTWDGRYTLHLPAQFIESTDRRGRSLDRSGDEGVSNDEVATTPSLGKRSSGAASLQRPAGSDQGVVAPGILTPLGLMGHSWGARACAQVAARGIVKVRAFGFIAGTWDDYQSVLNVVQAKIPTLMICGASDGMQLAPFSTFWQQLVPPKTQAVIQSLDHWDWFGPQGFIYPCSLEGAEYHCPIGWQIASELLLGFMTKHVKKQWWIDPSLLDPKSPGDRPPLAPWFDDDTECCCSVIVRWDDVLVHEAFSPTGEKTFGTWTAMPPPW